MSEEREAELEAEVARLKQEQRDLKQRVITVSRKYAEQHRLCAVVDQALEEAGLGPKLEAVSLDMLVPTKIELQVDATLLEGMSDEEKQTFIAQQITPALVTMIDRTKTRGLVPQPVGVGQNQKAMPDPKIEFGDIEVKGIGVIELPPPPPDPYNTPVGFLARYTSNEGRVVHYFAADQFREGGGILVMRSGLGNYVTALCGGVGYITAGNLRETSARGENRVCQTCDSRATSRGYARPSNTPTPEGANA